MVTRFSSISTRKLSKALELLTSNKSMVATSDYNEFHKMVKKYIIAELLGANAQVGSYNFIHLYVPSITLSTMPKICLINISICFSEATSNPQRHSYRKCFEQITCSYKELSSSSCEFQENIRVWNFWTVNETSEFLHFGLILNMCLLIRVTQDLLLLWLVGFGIWCGITFCGRAWNHFVKRRDI